MTGVPESEDFHNSLEAAEQEARKAMQAKLAQHLDLNSLTTNTMAFVITSAPTLPLTKIKQSFKVVMLLLNRMSNDIRTAGLLSWHGYALQSAALVADCHESAFSVLYVGSDDEMAQKWIDHNDPTVTPFGNIKDLTRRGFKDLKVPDVESQVEREYITYRQLCWAKHANPILQKWHGVRSQGDSIAVFNGPDTSEESVKVAAYALEHSAHLAYLALANFVDNHLIRIPEQTMAEIKQRIKTLGAEKSEIAKTSLKRWGNKDPFPGRWKV